jgi:hypothetical protein
MVGFCFEMFATGLNRPNTGKRGDGNGGGGGGGGGGDDDDDDDGKFLI